MVVEFLKQYKIQFCPAFQFFKIQSTYMKRHSIYRYNVVSGNAYALSGRHSGPHSSSTKQLILNWHDRLNRIINININVIISRIINRTINRIINRILNRIINRTINRIINMIINMIINNRSSGVESSISTCNNNNYNINNRLRSVSPAAAFRCVLLFVCL